jgi:methionyl-tRNA synthetase
MTTQTNRNHFFITTPIYYSNAIPHVGHAYSSCIADVYARFHRMLGYAVKFSTGVDENSQKTVQAAAAEGKEIHAYLDEYADKHRAMWDALRISYTDFVRTTAPTHQAYVQKILQQVYDHGDIYQGEYKGLYCVGCESFKKELDLIDGSGDFTGQKVCPDHLKPCDHLTEQNWFFKLSAYQDKLLAFYESHPDFIQPSHRYNEVLSFDPEHVTYVWFDALLNYVSICQ